MTREERLSFARGYADAWAKRDERETSEAYRRGYQEGEADRTRSDVPARRRAVKQ